MDKLGFEAGIKIKEAVICGLCFQEILYDSILGYYCTECGLTIIIRKRE